MSKTSRLALLLLAAVACKAEAPPVSHAPAPARDEAALARWDRLIQSLRADLIEGGAIRQPKVPVLQLRSAEKPTILAFWATYCPPCLEEMPMFDGLHGEGHPVIGVSMDTDNLEEVTKTLEARRPSYPQVVLREHSMKQVGLALERGLPVTVVLDRKGKTRAVIDGRADRAQILAAIELARPPPR